MYVTQSEIEAAIPGPNLIEACDDNGDGVADAGVLDQVIANAETDVNGFLAARFTVPFVAPLPAVVKAAAKAFACETIWGRRPIGEEKNPWSKRAADWRERLGKIGSGDLPLDASVVVADVPGRVVSETAMVDGTTA